MADTTVVGVEGLSRLVRELQGLGLEVDDLKDVFARIAAEAVPVYQGFAPVRTGRLRGDFRGNRAKSKAVVRVGRASVPYAKVQNYGWPARNIAAQGFVARGDAVMQPRALLELESGIRTAIKRRGLQ